MTAHWRPSADRLVADVQGVFGARLRSVVAYGPHLDGHEGPLSCLVLVTALTMADLDACARLAHGWRREHLAIPLVLPEAEFRQSFDAFPLEYGEILRAHEIVAGADPFDGVVVNPDDLRRACEAQVKSHLVHLREGFIEAGGTPHRISELVIASAAPFGALLRNLARLGGVAAGDRRAATLEGARLAQLPDAVVNEILSLEQPARIATTDAARLFPSYLAAVEALARFVDSWHA